MSYQKDRDEFVAVLATEFSGGKDGQRYDGLGLARLILRNAGIIQRIAVAGCNRPVSDAEKQQSLNAAIRIRKACEPWGIKPTFDGDPRGASVKLLLPSGRWNSFGGAQDGFCVPTR